jgi:CHAT domain-containing protein/tetratricopeptide (TPR) repeat protein
LNPGRQTGCRAQLRVLWVLAAIAVILITSAAFADELGELKCQRADLRARFLWREAAAVAAKVVNETISLRGEANEETTAAMYEHAWLVNCAGRHAEAEKLWRRTLDIQERLFGTNSVEVAVTLRSLGDVRQFAGDFLDARKIFLRAVANFQRNPDRNDLELGKALRSLGGGFLATDDWDKAEHFYRLAGETFRQLRPASPLDLADATTQLGTLYLRLGDPARAECHLQEALELRRRLPGADDVSIARLMCNLAEIHQRRGDFAGARSLFEESLGLLEKVIEPYEQQKLFPALLGLGTLLSDLRELDRAEPVLKRALDIARAAPWSEKSRGPTVSAALGRLHERQGHYEQARRDFQEACRGYAGTRGTNHSGTMATMRSLARVDLALGNRDRALSSAETILDGEERGLAEVLSFTSEQQRLAYQRDNHTVASLNLWATMGAARPLARAILRTKGIVLDSLLEERLVAEAGADPELREQVRQLLEARNRLARYGSLAVHQGAAEESPGTVSILRELSTQVESLEAALARSIAGLGRARRALSVEPGAIAAALPADTALVEFVRFKRHLGRDRWQSSYGALILMASEEPRWVALGPADQIDRNVKLFQHSVRDRSDPGALARVLRELHEQVWRPVQSELVPDARRIIISPDSQLNFLSFAALLTSGQEFLGESYSIGYVASGRDLLAPAEAVPGEPRLFVWANPDFGAVPANGGGSTNPGTSPDAGLLRRLHGFDFRRLPGAEKEGRTLSERARDFGFTSTELHLGRDATEAGLSHLHSPPVLHLATHGFVFPDDSGSVDSGVLNTMIANPMLRSGLALTGARRTLEAWSRGEPVSANNDGIVTAEELGCLHLRGTRLVVLSACDTGLGQATAGEGVLGLRRGFVQAGARNLLLTLWPIDDQRTAGFMPELYAAMNRSGDVAESLATVQRAWLTRLRVNKGVAEACRIAGPFILSFQGAPAPALTVRAASASTNREPAAR